MREAGKNSSDLAAGIPTRGDGSLARFLAELIARGKVSAAAALVAHVDRPASWAVAGFARSGTPVARGSLFDLASLTKPLMASLALVLDQEGRVPLALSLGEVFPNASASLARKSLSALLRHTAGFKPWVPLYALAGTRAEVLELLLSGRFSGEDRSRYSDLDFILWGLAVEQLSGENVDRLLAEHVLSRLASAAPEVTRRPDSAKVVACSLGGEKERELAAAQAIEIEPPRAPLPGEAQDGNARFLHSVGVAPAHAGLFGPLDALLAVSREWLDPSRLLTTQSVAKALQGRGPFALGWMRRRVRGAAGSALTPQAFGHTGFTGGSVWIDPTRGSIHVLLAHRTSTDVEMNAVRRRFHREFVREAS